MPLSVHYRLTSWTRLSVKGVDARLLKFLAVWNPGHRLPQPIWAVFATTTDTECEDSDDPSYSRCRPNVEIGQLPYPG